MAALETSDVTTVPPEVEGDGEDGVLGRAYRALSIGIVSVVLVIAFEATAVGTAMPVAARELDGVALYAFAFSGYFTTSLFGMVLAGQWSDRDGPLASLTVGIGAFAGGLLLSGTAGGMWLFVLGRAVQGLGGGLVIVALYVVVGRAYPERLRPAIMAAFAAAWVVPSVVGPLAAGAVTEHLGWRWVFLGIPALVGIPLALALPQIRRRAGGPRRTGNPPTPLSPTAPAATGSPAPAPAATDLLAPAPAATDLLAPAPAATRPPAPAPTGSPAPTPSGTPPPPPPPSPSPPTPSPPTPSVPAPSTARLLPSRPSPPKPSPRSPSVALPSTGGVSGWRSGSRSGPGCCSTRPRICGSSRSCPRWPVSPCSSPPCAGCCRTAPGGRRAGCRPSCSCAASRPGPSSPPSPSCR
ncbi:MFS transporter [Streptomyces sp. NPDC093509]|uniref:MFS transporter n=1 Tax=Streptomyces sp. NPDC093509 TaxID=3154982 RepID=UPI00344B3CB5